MSFYIDPKLKQIGASEMKDWIIFGLIVGFLLLIQYNVTVSHNQEIARMRMTITSVQADIEWLVSEHHKDHTAAMPDSVVTVPAAVPDPVVNAPAVQKPKIHKPKPKVAVKPAIRPVRIPISRADEEFGCTMQEETSSGECR